MSLYEGDCCIIITVLCVVDTANDIIDLSVNGKAQNQSYNRLAAFVDKFGSRIAGSQNLENAIGKY